MSPLASLRAALRDFYGESWRLFLLNAAFSLIVVPILVGGLWAWPVWLLLAAAGPPAAALMHCAVVVTRTGELRLADAVEGLRLHWRRGLALTAATVATLVLGVHAIDFYAGRSAPVLAVVAAYLLLALGAFQLLLWPLAVAQRALPLRVVARDAFALLLRRPLEALALALALLVVNAAGAAAAFAPLLTLTVAYTALAAARFALPPNPGGLETDG